MIQVSQLKKQYKEAVVLDIPELEISKGECFGLVGNNGAGKWPRFGGCRERCFVHDCTVGVSAPVKQLFSPAYGISRGTGALIHTEQGWKIAQYHLSFPIPNDKAKRITTLIMQ